MLAGDRLDWPPPDADTLVRRWRERGEPEIPLRSGVSISSLDRWLNPEYVPGVGDRPSPGELEQVRRFLAQPRAWEYFTDDRGPFRTVRQALEALGVSVADLDPDTPQMPGFAWWEQWENLPQKYRNRIERRISE